MKLLSAWLSLSLLAALPAQRMPVAGDTGRVLQLVDLQPLWPVADASTPTVTGPPARLTAVAAFVREFAQPPFGPGDDVRALGSRYLAVLAAPQQSAWIEQLVTHAANHRDELFLIEVKLLEVPAAEFGKHLQPFFAAAPADANAATTAGPQRVITMKECGELWQQLLATERITALQAPQLTVRSLDTALMKAGEEIPYIRDFTVSTQDDKQIADPAIGTLFDGVSIDVIAATLAKDQIGVHCTVEHQQVPKPLPETKVDLGFGAAVTIQLPRATTVRFEQRAILQPDRAVVIAAPRRDGSHLVAMLSISRAK